MDKSRSAEFESRSHRLQELIQALEESRDERTRTQARELVQVLLELHGAGINRMLELAFESEHGGQELIDRLSRDEFVSNLLLLHGLHPLSLEARVRNAIEEVKPRLELHGGSVQVLEVTAEGAVRLQLEGNCEGCPSSRMTLKYSIEEALYAAAPDLTALEVNGLSDEHAVPNAHPKFTECPSQSGNGQMVATGGK